jgi:hypothetical protein
MVAPCDGESGCPHFVSSTRFVGDSAELLSPV